MNTNQTVEDLTIACLILHAIKIKSSQLSPVTIAVIKEFFVQQNLMTPFEKIEEVCQKLSNHTILGKGADNGWFLKI